MHALIARPSGVPQSVRAWCARNACRGQAHKHGYICRFCKEHVSSDLHQMKVRHCSSAPIRCLTLTLTLDAIASRHPLVSTARVSGTSGGARACSPRMSWTSSSLRSTVLTSTTSARAG